MNARPPRDAPTQWLLSAIYVVQVYAVMAAMALAFLPWALVSAGGARTACRTWCRYARWSLAIVGLRCEVRGVAPVGEVLVAAKHQSFLDIILIFAAVPQGRFIMKRELLWTPIVGQFARRIGCIPVDRGRRGAAVAQMLADVETGRMEPGQLIIYPQGTRVAPGVAAPYRAGAGLIYEQLGQPCAPVATNVGLFWPRHGIKRRPGVAVVEFLAPIPPGLPRDEFARRMADAVETASDLLMAEAA